MKRQAGQPQRAREGFFEKSQTDPVRWVLIRVRQPYEKRKGGSAIAPRPVENLGGKSVEI